MALVVIGLIAAAVTLPYLAQSQRTARRVACSARQADAAMSAARKRQVMAAEKAEAKRLADEAKAEGRKKTREAVIKVPKRVLESFKYLGPLGVIEGAKRAAKSARETPRRE